MESASGEGKLTLREVASYAGTDTGKAVHALSIAVSNPFHGVAALAQAPLGVGPLVGGVL